MSSPCIISTRIREGVTTASASGEVVTATVRSLHASAAMVTTSIATSSAAIGICSGLLATHLGVTTVLWCGVSNQIDVVGDIVWCNWWRDGDSQLLAILTLDLRVVTGQRAFLGEMSHCEDRVSILASNGEGVARRGLALVAVSTKSLVSKCKTNKQEGQHTRSPWPGFWAGRTPSQCALWIRSCGNRGPSWARGIHHLEVRVSIGTLEGMAQRNVPLWPC